MGAAASAGVVRPAAMARARGPAGAPYRTARPFARCIVMICTHASPGRGGGLRGTWRARQGPTDTLQSGTSPARRARRASRSSARPHRGRCSRRGTAGPPSAAAMRHAPGRHRGRPCAARAAARIGQTRARRCLPSRRAPRPRTPRRVPHPAAARRGVAERDQVGEREPAPGRAQHREPGEAVAGLQQRVRERQQVLHRRTLAERVELDRGERTPASRSAGRMASRCVRARTSTATSPRLRFAPRARGPPRAAPRRGVRRGARRSRRCRPGHP